MAKRGTLDHPKTKRLARALGTVPGVALGLLETIWHWAGEFRKDGGLSKIDMEDALDAGGFLAMFSAAQVIEAMTDDARECIWLAALPDGRLYIHDWHDHAEDNVHRALARAGKRFADGTIPDMTRLAKDERERLQAAYQVQNAPEVQEVSTKDEDVRTTCAQSAPCHSHSHSLERDIVGQDPTPSLVLALDLPPEPPPMTEAQRRDAWVSDQIGYLNAEAGREYATEPGCGSGKALRALWNRYRGKPELTEWVRLVVDHRVALWRGDAKMAPYLRPSTVFGGKFDEYLAEARQWAARLDQVDQGHGGVYYDPATGRIVA